MVECRYVHSVDVMCGGLTAVHVCSYVVCGVRAGACGYTEDGDSVVQHAAEEHPFFLNPAAAEQWL